MATKNIHGFNIEYDEGSTTATNYLDHLENRLSHEEVKAFIESAKNDPFSKTHLEDSHGDQVTMVYKDDGSVLVRKRQ